MVDKQAKAMVPLPLLLPAACRLQTSVSPTACIHCGSTATLAAATVDNDHDGSCIYIIPPLAQTHHWQGKNIQRPHVKNKFVLQKLVKNDENDFFQL